jgi:hypothetical protein
LAAVFEILLAGKMRRNFFRLLQSSFTLLLLIKQLSFVV